MDELAHLSVAAVAGEYHSVAARAAAARADTLGLPFLCSSAVLDALTEQSTEWVARLAPPQSRGWRIYADFLKRNGPPSSRRLPGTGGVDRQVGPPRPATQRNPDGCPGRPAGVHRMGDVVGRRQRCDTVPALPARAPRLTRCASPDDSPEADDHSTLVRRLRRLRHGRGPRRRAAFSWRGPGGYRRILVSGCGRRHPRADPVLPRNRRERLAMGVVADSSCRSRLGRTWPLSCSPRQLKEHGDATVITSSAVPPRSRSDGLGSIIAAPRSARTFRRGTAVKGTVERWRCPVEYTQCDRRAAGGIPAPSMPEGFSLTETAVLL